MAAVLHEESQLLAPADRFDVFLVKGICQPQNIRAANTSREFNARVAGEFHFCTDFFIFKNQFLRRSPQDDSDFIPPVVQQGILRTLVIGFARGKLLLCLLVIELTDVMFSFDSVPAVIAVSREPLIVYSAMIFAILGLRSMYFVLESLKKYICHLEKSVIVLLFFIAFKLCYNSVCEIFETGYPIGNIANLLIILVILSAGIIASILFPVKKIQ